MFKIIGWLIGFAVIWWILNTIGIVGKYEGHTAKEWFNSYDEEAAANDDLKYCLSNLPTGNYKGTNTFSLTSDIQDCVDRN